MSKKHKPGEVVHMDDVMYIAKSVMGEGYYLTIREKNGGGLGKLLHEDWSASSEGALYKARNFIRHNQNLVYA